MAWPRVGAPFGGAANGHIDVTYDAEARLLGSVIDFIKRRRLRHADAPSQQATTSKATTYLATLSQAYGSLPAGVLAEQTPAVTALVIDPAILHELARGNARARAHIARAAGALARIMIPATALLDARLAGVADAVGSIAPIDAEIARAAGELIGRARLAMPLDALTVALAARQPSAALLTTDRIGMAALARAANHPALHLLTL
ncbi:MAG: hypothetical protein GIX03_08720 [Candidatus Eremiobacteraeota bacterium]|nr:hypothetical protein [Candidatus Eremiobacteraeota bacterium]MBC5803063.1 hypothetical protein [Candidatus Eremiobacteraeota bacterium]MBC5820515.1 hypothetical protein [Candidatus Eremiobacteraeota bacterium]